MATIENYLTEWSVSVDGKGYAGKAKSITVPKLNQQFTEFKASGMTSAIDVPMPRHEKLEAQLVLNSFDFDILKEFGVAPGNTVPFIVRGALTNRTDEVGAVTPVVIEMTGFIKSFDMGSWEAGGETSLNLGMTLSYYKLTHGGQDVTECDVEGMKWLVNGKDLLEATRGALGL